MNVRQDAARIDGSRLDNVATRSAPARKVVDKDNAKEIERREPLGARGAGSKRIVALDFTKGALVLIMVLYHWLNYFVGSEGQFYRYLSFLPPSFICITGFLISQVYLAKYKATDTRLYRRLIIRGLKILGIFVLLNVVIGLVFPRGSGTHELMTPAAFWSVFVSGDMGTGRIVSFYVLLPISYVLILSAVMLLVFRGSRYIFYFATAAAMIGIVLLKVIGKPSEDLELVSFGLVGICIGYIPIESIKQQLLRPYVIVPAYLLYLAAITAWNTPYPLQLTGVLLTLLFIYWAGQKSGNRELLSRIIVLLGKYSLFGYIAQIAFLRALRNCFGAELRASVLIVSLIGAAMITVATVGLMDRARVRVPLINRAYNAVFS